MLSYHSDGASRHRRDDQDRLGSRPYELPLLVRDAHHRAERSYVHDDLPASDGDVVDNNGAQFYDVARPGPFKCQLYVHSTNHNFFNRRWLGDDGVTTVLARGLQRSRIEGDHRRRTEKFLRIGNPGALSHADRIDPLQDKKLLDQHVSDYDVYAMKD